jgi:gamma-glutamylputrescine oxidase
VPCAFTTLFLFLPLATLTIACMPQLSVWEKETFFAPQDIIIIGSGFVGLWSALKLAEKNPHHTITILERGIIPTGASTRNAGFSCFGSPSELLHDVDDMGEEKTFELVTLRYKGLQEIRKYFADDVIGYDASGGYECFTNGSADWKLVDEQLGWLNKKLAPVTGEEKTFRIADDKISSFGFKGFDHLIENRLEGGLHSGKLVQALLRKVQSLGVQVLTGIEVKSFEQKNGTVIIETNPAFNFTAKQLLLCTNAFTKALVPGADIIPNRGQVLITGELPGLTIKGTFHFDKGYYYFRNLGNRLLLGGGRNKAFEEEATAVMATTDTIQNELESFIKKHLLPAASFTITDRWSGIMAMGAEKLPVVKAVDENIFCCVRMSGMGVALAPVVAEQVAGLMQNL